MENSQHNREYTQNNFDLIRLFAAIQVAHFHIFNIMGIRVTDLHAKITSFLGFFPGVPIFFFISGFLISKSWERHPNLKNYAANRFLRIYPGLICAVTLSFIFIHASGYVGLVNPGFGELVLLFLAKSTILQFYNPDFMRGYGDGVLNGSLWTITVEIQFYVLTPLCYAAFKRLKGIDYNRAILFLICGFLAINVIYGHLYAKYFQNVIFKLFGVSFLPWLYMFLLGVFFQRKFDLFYPLLKGKGILCFFIYVCIAIILGQFGAHFGNLLFPPLFFLLACVIFSTAFSYTSLSDKILRGTDISYGIYLYHMPFVNVMIFMSGSKSYIAGLAVAGAIISMSLASWFLVERRALKFKPNSIKRARY
jgi:peptidoglycan/LPS O-acetylase OafA/YrhL